jgi:hypothetical protein
MTRTFWLSFVDRDAPAGQRFKGVCIIDVDELEAGMMKREVDARFPHHAADAEWLAAATRKAWEYGCNPGGEVGSMELVTTHPAPRNRLLTREELTRWGQRAH